MTVSCSRRRFVSAGTASFGTLAFLGGLAGRGALAQSVPRSDFPPDVTAEAVTEGLDLAGKTALVTGCNSGIGYETMRVLALRGAHVIGTARTIDKGRDACASVEGRATPVVLELTDFDSVVDCARQVADLTPAVDMLICNAGVLLTELEQVNGLEMQFVVNHLGHFLLTNRLLDRITAASAGRIVVVGSMAHRQVPEGGIQFDNLSGEGWAGQAYGHSKLANGLFSLELARRLSGSGATSNSLHPGVVSTNIFRNMNFQPGGGGGFRLETPAQGAANSCYVAAHPLLDGVTGQYFVDCNPADQSDYQRDPDMARRLWETSTELVGDWLV